MSFHDSTRTRILPGIFPGRPPYGPYKPGPFPAITPEQMPTVVIVVLFTMAVAAGQHELATALGTLLAAPQLVRRQV